MDIDEEDRVDQEHITYEFSMLHASIMNFGKDQLMTNFCTITGYNCIRNLIHYLETDLGINITDDPKVGRVYELMHTQIHSLGPTRTTVMADKLAIRDMVEIYKVIYKYKKELGLPYNPAFEQMSKAVLV